jgi:hypothetical protein
MTDAELELALKEVQEKLAPFGPENKLSGKEWREYNHLAREKALLENIKKARANKNTFQEAKQMSHYALLKEDRKMNPFVRYIMHLKFRSQIWM